MIQRADYIEDGWYIAIDKHEARLYEIPTGGGKPQVIGTYKTFKEAHDKAMSLT